jgi:ABC-2 type transport system permease protein
MKNYWRTTLILCKALTLRFFRDKVALFFTFLFPLLFLVVFGSLNRGSNDVSFDVAIINRSQTSFAQEFVKEAGQNKVLKIQKDTSSLQTAKEEMGRSELDSIIELPKEFGTPNAEGIPSGRMVVYYEAANPQTGQTLAGILQQELDKTNRELTGHIDPLAVEAKSTKTANLTSFDYVFSGLLGFTALSLGIFGMANGFPVEKRTGRLRRLRATPLRASQLILATAIEYLLIGMVSIATMFIAGLLIFDFNMRGDYLSFTLFTMLGVFVMFGFGLAIGGWAKNENQAAPLANLVAFPLMFLSGVFFPRFLMPDWLDKITYYLPLTPVVDGTRYILTEGKTILQLGPELLVIGIWTVVIYAIAIRCFRWE